MIQRVQSVWLFLAAITLLILLILPLVTRQAEAGEIWFQIGGIYEKTNTAFHQVVSQTALFGLTLVTGLLCLVNIFFFKNRDLQKKLIWLISVFIIGLSVWAGMAATALPGGLEGASFHVGVGLPVIALIFCALAYRGIRQDELLIRSADRLR